MRGPFTHSHIHMHLAFHCSKMPVVPHGDDAATTFTFWDILFGFGQTKSRRNVCMKKKKEEEGKKWNENKNKTKTISFPNPADVFKLSVFAFQNVMNFDTLCALLDRDMRPPSHTSSKNNNNKSNNNDRLRANKSKSKTDRRKGKGEKEQAFFWVNFDKYTAERWNPN